MARPKGLTMAELKRIKRKLSVEMAAAQRKGRLTPYLRQMHRKGKELLEEARTRVRTRRRKHA